MKEMHDDTIVMYAGQVAAMVRARRRIEIAPAGVDSVATLGQPTPELRAASETRLRLWPRVV